MEFKDLPQAIAEWLPGSLAFSQTGTKSGGVQCVRTFVCSVAPFSSSFDGDDAGGRCVSCDCGACILICLLNENLVLGYA